MKPQLRQQVKQRSGGRCEAYIAAGPKIYRCLHTATEIHHLLTTARGGRLLDRVGEMYHLIHLCHPCHEWSDGAKAYLGKMLIEGTVTWDKINGKPIYSGPDQYLSERYGSYQVD